MIIFQVTVNPLSHDHMSKMRVLRRGRNDKIYIFKNYLIFTKEIKICVNAIIFSGISKLRPL